MGGTQTVATSTISGYVYEAMTGPGASTSIDVIAPPSIATSFNPGTIDQGGTAAHVITITNPSANPRPLTGVHFTESLPAGLTVASAAGSMCGGTLTLTAPNSIALSDVSIPTGGTRCQFSFTVTGSHPGTLTATTSHVGSGNGGTGNAASARLVVRAPATPTPAPTPPPAEPATPPPAEVTPAPAEVTPAPVATESVEVPAPPPGAATPSATPLLGFPPASSGGGDSSGLLAVGGVLVGLIGGGLIVAFFMRRQRDTAAPSGPPPVA